MAQCKTSSVVSIAVYVTPSSGSDSNLFILVGGNNGEIEVITYGLQSNSGEQDDKTHGTKVITTLWKNSKNLMTSYDLDYSIHFVHV